MITTPPPAVPTPDKLPHCVRRFVERHGLPPDAIRGSGRVVITIDARYRIHIIPASHSRVALQAELSALPTSRQQEWEDDLLRLCNVGCGLLKDHASTLAIDTARRALVLQHLVSADCDSAAFEEAVADFTNALAFWAPLCKARFDPLLERSP